MPRIALILAFMFSLTAFGQQKRSTHYTGVYQGNTLFIQNPYHSKSQTFCISEILVNGRELGQSYTRTAIKIDFDQLDEFVPVTIEIRHKSGCKPIVINPDAIQYHSMFSFKSIEFNDSTIAWVTKGEQEEASFIMERYQQGIWLEEQSIDSKGNYTSSTYEWYPKLKEGPNKYRIKYLKPDGGYLYSQEIDFHFYPDPVTFQPAQTSRKLTLSRFAYYEIFDAGGNLVMSGEGNEIDVSPLPRGDYVVYFNEQDPGTFKKL